MQPAQLTLTYAVTPSGGGVVADIDIAKDLSAVNRRLYRQGMQYAVASVKFSRTMPGLSFLACQTAGNTWMVHNAWKKGKALWDRQQREVAKAMPGIHGTWADFKIELDDNSTTAIDTIAGDAGTVVPDEWNLSNYVWDNDGTERQPTFCLLGATAPDTKIGMVQEYHIARAQVQNSPAVPTEASDSIYAKSLGTDEMSDLLIDVVELDNDNAPYDMTEMVGGDTVADTPWSQDYVTSTMESPGQSKPFLVECGLLRLQLQSVLADGTSASDVIHFIQVNLVPGGYKGVLAEPMGQ